MTTLLPLPPRLLFGHLTRPVWAVVRDGTTIGEIEQLGTPPAMSYWWRVNGMPFFCPCSTGAWWQAQEMVERCADGLSGYRGKPMPPDLKISQLRQEVAKQSDQETPA